MLRRIALSLMVLGVISFGLMPGGIGLILSKVYPDMIANLDESLSAAGLEVANFEGGWFTSTARGRFAGTQERPGNWHDTIAHGPVPWRLENRTPAWLGGQFQFGKPDSDAKGAAEYRVNLDGSIEIQTRLEHLGSPFSTVQSGPLSLRTLVRRGNESADFNLQSQSLVFRDAAVSELAGTMLHARVDKAPTGFWAVNLTAQIARTALSMPAALGAEDLSLELKTNANEGLASVALQLDAARASGPGMTFTDLTGAMVLSNLDELALGAILKKMGKGGDPASRNAAILGEVLAQAPILLHTEPRLEVRDFLLQAPSGPVSCRVDLTLLNPDTRLLAEPIYLLAYLNGDIELKLPEQVARQWVEMRLREKTPDAAGSSELIDAAVSHQLAEFVDNGWFVREGLNLVTAIRFDSGTASINGKSIPLPSAQSRGLSAGGG